MASLSNQTLPNAPMRSDVRSMENGSTEEVLTANGIALDDIAPNMSSDELDVFRTIVCGMKKRSEQTGLDCPKESDCAFSHCISWQRRSPSQFSYSPQMCPRLSLHRESAVKGLRGSLKVTNLCSLGQRCSFSHTKEEQLYHPQVYKTKICKGWKAFVSQLYADGNFIEGLDDSLVESFKRENLGNASPCHKYYCPFAHGPKELRRTNNNYNNNTSNNSNNKQTNQFDHQGQNKSGFRTTMGDRFQRAESQMSQQKLEERSMDNKSMDDLHRTGPTARASILKANQENYNKFKSIHSYDPNSVFDLGFEASAGSSQWPLASLESQQSIDRLVDTKSFYDDTQDKSTGQSWLNYQGWSFPVTTTHDPIDQTVRHEATITCTITISNDTAANLTKVPMGRMIKPLTERGPKIRDPATYMKSLTTNYSYDGLSMFPPYTSLQRITQDYRSTQCPPDLRSMPDFSSFMRPEDMFGGKFPHSIASVDNCSPNQDLMSQGGMMTMDDGLNSVDAIQHINNQHFSSGNGGKQRYNNMQPNPNFPTFDQSEDPTALFNTSRGGSIDSRSVDAYGVDAGGNRAF